MRFLTPLIHPASVMRGRWYLAPVQVAYLKRIAQDPHPKLVDVRQPPPHCNPNPTLDDLRSFTALLTGFYQLCSFDIENAGPHLVCCGVLAMCPDTLAVGPGVCFRFRRKGGEPWWPNFQEHLEVVTLLDSILGDPGVVKVGHFSTMHDIPFLTNLGFQVRGRLIDTAYLLHTTHAELQKGLAFNATLFCGAPRWKDIPDEKEMEPDGDSAESDSD
ncbi:MAG: hypothetical protein L0191_08590 [Acidobacteria bacterium]|nr:hypothetical protein [Acidobacteriota bacterium]